MLAALPGRVRPAILKLFAPQSCLATTRVTIEICRYFGFDVRPLKVRVLVANTKWVELMKEGTIGWGERLPEEATKQGAWALSVGSDRFGEPGLHLVALVDGRFIADYSIDQASRPRRDIDPPPSNFVLHPDQAPAFLDGSGLAGPYVTGESKNTHLLYHRDPRRAETWKSAPDWRYKSRWEPIAGAIIRALREEGLTKKGEQ